MYDVKDSGERQQFESGMVRDVTEGKIDYSLILDGPMFDRWAVHLTKGAQKYAKRNWMLANGDAELARFKESALRHFLQWYRGDVDEDHAAAVFFNINGAEFVKAKPAQRSITFKEALKAAREEEQRLDILNKEQGSSFRGILNGPRAKEIYSESFPEEGFR